MAAAVQPIGLGNSQKTCYKTFRTSCPPACILIEHVDLTSCPSRHGPELIALLHLPLDEGHEEAGVAAEAHVGHDAEDEALLLVVVGGLVLVPRLLDVRASPAGETALDRLRVVAGPPARDPDQVSEGERDRHLGEPSRAVPRQQLLELCDHLLVGPPDVEGDLGTKCRSSLVSLETALEGLVIARKFA